MTASIARLGVGNGGRKEGWQCKGDARVMHGRCKGDAEAMRRRPPGPNPGTHTNLRWKGRREEENNVLVQSDQLLHKIGLAN